MKLCVRGNDIDASQPMQNCTTPIIYNIQYISQNKTRLSLSDA